MNHVITVHPLSCGSITLEWQEDGTEVINVPTGTMLNSQDVNSKAGSAIGKKILKLCGN